MYKTSLVWCSPNAEWLWFFHVSALVLDTEYQSVRKLSDSLFVHVTLRINYVLQVKVIVGRIFFKSYEKAFNKSQFIFAILRYCALLKHAVKNIPEFV